MATDGSIRPVWPSPSAFRTGGTSRLPGWPDESAPPQRSAAQLTPKLPPPPLAPAGLSKGARPDSARVSVPMDLRAKTYLQRRRSTMDTIHIKQMDS